MAGDFVISTEGFVRTYRPPSYSDPSDLLEDYERVMRHVSYHPNKGSSAVSTALGLSRSRIRGWMEGGQPDCVRGLEQARKYGWVPLSTDDDLRPWATLIAWIFSGGSIDRNWRPSFVANNQRSQRLVIQALEGVGAEAKIATRKQGRATEIFPAENASVLGRVLYVLGAPSGSKAEADVELPMWVRDAPLFVKIRFAEAYLLNRGQVRENGIVTLREEREQAYLSSLADFFSELAGAPVGVSEKNLIFSTDAVRSLGLIQTLS